jgi:hypothetical protein
LKNEKGGGAHLSVRRLSTSATCSCVVASDIMAATSSLSLSFANSLLQPLAPVSLPPTSWQPPAPSPSPSLRLQTAQIMLTICYQVELDKLNICETLTCSIPKMCWWLCMRFCTISSCCLSLSSTALSAAREERANEEVEVLVHYQA